MNGKADALWSRALKALNARGLLPDDRSRLTPAELAAEVARRGEGRLIELVDGWYYPTSYGRVDGVLSDAEADRLVAALETAAARASAMQPEREEPRALRVSRCQLCGAPVRGG